MQVFTVEESISHLPVKIKVEGLGEAEGEFIRFQAPRTVDAILRVLPIEGRAALWQEEIYFEIPVKGGKEKAVSEVEKGTIAYWPMGKALCIFFGTSQPYSAVNKIGRIMENLELFKEVRSGTKIRVERG